MTTIRISGKAENVDKIWEDLREHVPDILDVRKIDGNTEGSVLLYVTVMDPLQKEAIGNVQDWAILEYCKTWRSTPEIMKYFKLDYEPAREMCDRMYSNGTLCRRLRKKSYEYVDRGRVQRCVECAHLQGVGRHDDDIDDIFICEAQSCAFFGGSEVNLQELIFCD